MTVEPPAETYSGRGLFSASALSTQHEGPLATEPTSHPAPHAHRKTEVQEGQGNPFRE